MKNFRMILLYSILCISLLQPAIADSNIEVIHVQGEVKVRKGLQETWIPAVSGMELKEIDTILSLEGEVVLRINGKNDFHLGNHSILDIGDLRKITKRELFLFLMSQKINNMESRKEKTKLRVGNVSVIHGTSRNEPEQKTRKFDKIRFMQEMNGAKALYQNTFYTNTIVSLYKILNRSLDNICPGEIYFYLGKSFEMLNEPGQAVDNYQNAIECTRKNESTSSIYWLKEAREAVNSLKNKE